MRGTIALLASAEALIAPLRGRLGADTVLIARMQVARSPAQRDRRAPQLAIVASTPDRRWEWLDVVRQLREDDPTLPVVLLVVDSSEQVAVTALHAGVTKYFRVPFAESELLASIHALLAGRFGGDPLPATVDAMQTLVGDSLPIREVQIYVRRVAATDVTVLITGETGTGKELVASLLHQSSRRRGGPFVAINCAAIPEGLLESELFGHERGAFTGAHAASAGHLAAAHGGTVFLDEVGDMSPAAQAKVLRVLDAREVYRVGGTSRVPLDVRIVAATNHDLPKLIAEGRFRRDLYYRLRVAEVTLPPLRERKDDIPALVQHCIREFNGRFGHRVTAPSADVLVALLAYEWPGNVRELRNLIESAYAELPPRPLDVLELPRRMLDALRIAAPRAACERERLLSVLSATKWNKSRAANELHWSRMTLYRKIAKYGVGDPRPRPRA